MQNRLISGHEGDRLGLVWWFRFGALALALLLTAAACASPTGDTTTPRGDRILGFAQFVSGDADMGPWDSCDGYAHLSGVAPGSSVHVTNEQGAEIGVGTLQNIDEALLETYVTIFGQYFVGQDGIESIGDVGPWVVENKGRFCILWFVTLDVPYADIYTFDLEGGGAVSFTRSELEEGNFQIGFFMDP